MALLSRSFLTGFVNWNQVNKLIGRFNLCNHTSTTIGSNDYHVPNSMLEVGTPVEVSLADTSNDDLTLGTTNALTGNTVVGRLPDIGTASVYRRTCIINGSGGDADVTVADETNTTINGQSKRLTLTSGGYVILEETANDAFRIVEGDKVALEAFVSSASSSISSSTSSSPSSSTSSSASSSPSSSTSSSASSSSSSSTSSSPSSSPSTSA